MVKPRPAQWAVRRAPRSLVADSFESFILLLSIFSGVTSLLPAYKTPVLFVLPEWFRLIWSWGLITAPTVAVTGLFMGDTDDPDKERFWRRVERLGLILIAVLSLGYAIALFSFGVRGFVAGFTTLGYVCACAARAIVIDVAYNQPTRRRP